MIDIVKSVNKVPIRLTEERWYHIIEHHDEMAGYVYEVLNAVSEPDFVVKGWVEELLAVKEITDSKYLIVVYKEISEVDGFIITAYFTKRILKIRERKKIWQK